MDNNNTDKQTVISRLVNAGDKFFHSNISFIIFSVTMIVWGLIMFLIAAFTDYQIGGTSDITNFWLYFYLFISISCTTLSLIGYVYVVRIDKKFFWPTTIGQSLTLVMYIFLGLTWTSIAFLIFISTSIYRYIAISKYGSGYEVNTRVLTVVTLCIILIMYVIGFRLILTDHLGAWSLAADGKEESLAKFDVFSSIFLVIAAMLLVAKNKYSFVVFMVVNVLYLTLNFMATSYVPCLQILIFLTCNGIAALAWSKRDKEQSMEL